MTEHTKRIKINLRGRPRRAVVTIPEILAWAAAHHAATGVWPIARSGSVCGAPHDITWQAVDRALIYGLRSLPGGSSLHCLLAAHHDVRSPLTLERVLAWADAYHAATGTWPKDTSGRVIGVYGENWSNVNRLLRLGGRGLPGGLSLSLLLHTHRGLRTRQVRGPLTVDAILAWGDAHHAATGEWPTRVSGPVRDAPYDLSWNVVCLALRKGRRGLPGSMTLLRLWIKYRNFQSPLTLERILAWADAHHAATGRWPTYCSGNVQGVSGEIWRKINSCLSAGCRGLPGGQTLSRVLLEHRGVRNVDTKSPLNVDQILAWADAHHAATGRWPTSATGPVDHAPGVNWHAINSALITGGRGLVGRSSLRRLLEAHKRPPKLTVKQILAWADAHHAATGRWPTPSAGAVDGVPGETWTNISCALSKGQRGLPEGLSLAGLRVQYRAHLIPRFPSPDLTVDQILAWADAHHAARGEWPRVDSGPISATHGETWSEVAAALDTGRRGLKGGMTLGRLLVTRRYVQL